IRAGTAMIVALAQEVNLREPPLSRMNIRSVHRATIQPATIPRGMNIARCAQTGAALSESLSERSQSGGNEDFSIRSVPRAKFFLAAHTSTSIVDGMTGLSWRSATTMARKGEPLISLLPCPVAEFHEDCQLE